MSPVVSQMVLYCIFLKIYNKITLYSSTRQTRRTLLFLSVFFSQGFLFFLREKTYFSNIFSFLVMEEQKRKVGRPRKYENNAAKSREYRRRAKERIQNGEQFASNKKGGRPRLHKDNKEKYKAYRQRKKQTMQVLKKAVVQKSQQIITLQQQIYYEQNKEELGTVTTEAPTATVAEMLKENPPHRVNPP